MVSVAIEMFPTCRPIGMSLVSLQHSLGRIRGLVGSKVGIIDLEGVHARFSVDVEGVRQLRARPAACQLDESGTGWLMLRVFSDDRARWLALRERLGFEAGSFVFMTVAVKAGEVEPGSIKRTLTSLRVPKHAAAVYATMAEQVLDATLAGVSMGGA